MLVNIYGINKYIQFCAGKTDKERPENVLGGEEEEIIGNLQSFNQSYTNLLSKLQELSTLQEKARNLNSEIVRIFHDQKSEENFSNYIPTANAFENPEELNSQIDNIKNELKDMVKNLGNDLKSFQEQKKSGLFEGTRSEIVNDSKELLEEYNKKKNDNRLNYSEELSDLFGSIVEKKFDLDLESAEACDKLLGDMKSNKLNLNEHIQFDKNIKAKEGILDDVTHHYENAWVFRSIEELEKNGNVIEKDGERINGAYESFSKILNGNAEKEDSDNVLSQDYFYEVSNNRPKPKLGIKIQNAFRKLIGKPTYLLTTDEQAWQSRYSTFENMDSRMYNYLNENNLIPQLDKEKSDFDKSIEVDIEQIMKSQKSEDEKSTEENKTKSGLKVIEEGPEFDD